jgi:hypothetical protein
MSRERPVPNAVDKNVLGLTLASTLALHLVLGCGGGSAAAKVKTGQLDAGADAADFFDVDNESVNAKPDARTGIAGGNACEASAQCLSGACTGGVCSDWSHVMRIGIDTTADGADVEYDVADFPLLIRLAEGGDGGTSNFVFAEANDDGSDIRFTDSEGSNLNYQIERWNPNLHAAEIWVLVPYIAGSSADNFILMYWHNPSAIPLSFGPSVFSDFACVLHMDEGPNSRRIADASGQGHDGLVTVNSGTEFSGSGIVGSGLVLDGSSTSLTTSTQFPAEQVFSISLWLNSASPTGGGIAAFISNPSGNTDAFDTLLWMDANGRISFAVMRETEYAVISTPGSYSDNTWHFLTARLSNSGQFLFVDGEPIAGDTTTTSADANAGTWLFGDAPVTRFPAATPAMPTATSNFISGTIDEVRVATNEQSDASIRLSFATQRLPSPAVSYLPQP